MAKTIRDAYGEALVKYGEDDARIIVLDADVSSSTKTTGFQEAYPDRFFNVGIAEANMVAMAAGFASEGKIPFANTFAVFMSTIGSLAARTLGGYSELNIKLIGAYGGMSDAYDGATHHSIEDIAIMRSIPNFAVMVASDEYQCDWLVKNAIDVNMPMFIRLSRDAMPKLYSPDEKFEMGKGKVLRDGKDATIISCGVLCGTALEAAKLLASEGIEVRVVDMFTVKPIDTELINCCAKETKAIVTAEEHNVIGGLGSAVAEVMVQGNYSVPMEMAGIDDVFSQTGSYGSLLKEYKLDAPSLVKKVKKAISRA